MQGRGVRWLVTAVAAATASAVAAGLGVALPMATGAGATIVSATGIPTTTGVATGGTSQWTAGDVRPMTGTLPPINPSANIPPSSSNLLAATDAAATPSPGPTGS